MFIHIHTQKGARPAACSFGKYGSENLGFVAHRFFDHLPGFAPAESDDRDHRADGPGNQQRDGQGEGMAVGEFCAS